MKRRSVAVGEKPSEVAMVSFLSPWVFLSLSSRYSVQRVGRGARSLDTEALKSS